MGLETANIHLGSFSREYLEKRLNELDRDKRWFAAAADQMTAITRKDHATWANHYPAAKNDAVGHAELKRLVPAR